jgi:hypothetical protein
MKRPYRKEFVTEQWPIFSWKQCCICKYEFRREHGWKCYYNPSRNPYLINPGLDIYLCQSCAPTKFDAEYLFNRWADEREKRTIPLKEE